MRINCRIAVTYFCSILIKDHIEFICFRKVLSYQVKEGLTNIPFNICRKGWIYIYTLVSLEKLHGRVKYCLVKNVLLEFFF